MCPHATTIYLSSTTIRSTCRSALILLHLGPHTAADVSSCYFYICRLLQYMQRPNTATSRPSYCCRCDWGFRPYKCVLILHIYVLVLLHLGPHTAAYASSYGSKSLRARWLRRSTHTAMYVSSYYYLSSYWSKSTTVRWSRRITHGIYQYICVVIELTTLFYICPHTSISSALIVVY